MKVTKIDKNKFQVDDDDLGAVSVSTLKGKAIKNMTSAEKYELLVALAQAAGLCDKAGVVKGKGKP